MYVWEEFGSVSYKPVSMFLVTSETEQNLKALKPPLSRIPVNLRFGNLSSESNLIE